jgi:hypothetical protein
MIAGRHDIAVVAATEGAGVTKAPAETTAAMTAALRQDDPDPTMAVSSGWWIRAS